MFTTTNLIVNVKVSPLKIENHATTEHANPFDHGFHLVYVLSALLASDYTGYLFNNHCLRANL